MKRHASSLTSNDPALTITATPKKRKPNPGSDIPSFVTEIKSRLFRGITMLRQDVRNRMKHRRDSNNSTDGGLPTTSRGLAEEMDELALGPSKVPQQGGKLYPPLPIAPPTATSSSTSSAGPTLYCPPQLRSSAIYEQQMARQRQIDAARNPPDSPDPLAIVPVPSAGVGAAGHGKGKRRHILKNKHAMRVGESRRATVENAKSEVAIGMRIGDASSVGGKSTTSDGEFLRYRQRVAEATQAAFETSTNSRSRQKKEGSIKSKVGQLDRALKNVKATMDSPLPPAPSLPALERLLLQEKKRDKTFAKPPPRRRKWRTSLSPEQLRVVKTALSTHGEVSSIPGGYVEGKDVCRLKPKSWLNDEIVTFYGVLINQRSAAAEKAGTLEKGGLLKVHCMSSFFMGVFEKKGHAGVKKWTKKVDLFERDMVIFPLNLGNLHWTCAAINIRQKRFEFYDSLGSKNYDMLERLREYLNDEWKTRKEPTEGPQDFNDWEDYFDDSEQDLPGQQNGYDCGVFVCQFMDCLSKTWKGSDTVFDFGQDQMDYIRLKMIYELASKQLVDESHA